MLKKTLTYTDYNGNEVTDDLYFHLSTMEVVRIQTELDMQEDEELDEYALRISQEKNLKAILQFIDLIVQRSYGVRSSDGKRFDKSPKVLDDLLASPKYDALIDELLFVDGAAQEFASSVGILDKKEKVTPELKVLDEPTPQLTPEQLMAKIQSDPILMQKLMSE